MKRIIIVGCNGQDGNLLYDLLASLGCEVLGIARKTMKATVPINHLPENVDIGNCQQVFSLVEAFQPDEIYYLAAFHHSAEEAVMGDAELFKNSYNVNAGFLVHFLEAIRCVSKKTRLFYAASSHVFGMGSEKRQDEQTPISPTCVYGITKASGLFTCRYYREEYSVFATTGILYNHESSYRSEKFVSKKIIKGAINIKNGKADKLVLGNLKAEIDWGYAPDYVEAMTKLLSIEVSGEFIIATGVKHTVLDFVEETFSLLGLDWTKYVFEDQTIVKKPSILRIGNPHKLISATGWNPKTTFKQMIETLLLEEGAFD